MDLNQIVAITSSADQKTPQNHRGAQILQSSLLVYDKARKKGMGYGQLTGDD